MTTGLLLLNFVRTIVGSNHNKIPQLLESAAQIAEKDAKKVLNEKFISVDTRQVLGRKGEIRKIPYDPLQDIGQFLDDIWFGLQKAGCDLPAFRYGEAWFLEDADTGQIFLNLGRDSKSNSGLLDEYKSIAEANIKPGMKLVVFFRKRGR